MRQSWFTPAYYEEHTSNHAKQSNEDLIDNLDEVVLPLSDVDPPNEEDDPSSTPCLIFSLLLEQRIIFRSQKVMREAYIVMKAPRAAK